jgi:hypothetical protein
MAVDPGEHTGFAIYDFIERRFIETQTFDHPRYKWVGMHRLLNYLDSVIPSVYPPEVVHVIIEYPPAFVYRRNASAGGSASGGNRHAFNIGGVRREAELIFGKLVFEKRLPYVDLVPPVRAAKWSAADAERFTGIKRMSQHARDAARLALHEVRGL